MAASRSRPDVSHFEFEPTFDYNLLHWKGSLNGVGNRFRLIADQYRSKVRTAARKELSSYKARMNNVSNRYSNTGSTEYLMAKAMVYSLSRYVELVYAIEEHGTTHNRACVAAGHAAGAQIEYGGADMVIDVDGYPLHYPAMSILRSVL